MTTTTLDQFANKALTLLREHEQASVFSIGAMILLSLVVMSVVTLGVLNSKSTNGYQLNELEATRQQLVEDGEITEMLTLQARSLDQVMESSVVQYMSEPDRNDVTYVSPVEVPVYAEVGW